MNADNKRERSHLGELIVQELIERTEEGLFTETSKQEQIEECRYDFMYIGAYKIMVRYNKNTIGIKISYELWNLAENCCVDSVEESASGEYALTAASLIDHNLALLGLEKTESGVIAVRPSFGYSLAGNEYYRDQNRVPLIFNDTAQAKWFLTDFCEISEDYLDDLCYYNSISPCPDCGYPVFDLPEEGKTDHCIHCNDNYLKARVGNTLDL